MPDESLSTPKKRHRKSRVSRGLLRTLFAIENRPGKRLPERLEIRQKQSVPVLAELRQKLLVWKEQLLPSIPWPMR